MYFMSTSLTIIFQIAFGLVDLFNVGAHFKSVPIIIICGQVFFLQLGLQTFPNLLSSELFPNDARYLIVITIILVEYWQQLK